ncbi:Transposase IS116/IS110/IS902 family [Moraxella equi]|uniref:Transposase IS116/IS110/IS902 family n=1 Tax=Moraxella equi TaxID=60442 RepID=A0A378QNU2_9GAMM|nr:Transposase IS116/IS110/IS902 family [Moraxella equi]
MVLESTGGLEGPLAKALCLAGICVMIANPRQTHQFAKSQSLTKTDNKDAKMLAFYAKMMAQRDDLATLLYCPPSQSQELLTALINRRNQFVQMCTAEKNRLEQSHHSQVGSIQAHIAYLTEQIHELDKQIKTHLDDHHPDLKQKGSVIQSIKGIGQTTTATLLAMLPELGTISHKQLASLVGVAPHPKQSGETKFKGLCQAGRAEVRKALYMATLVATRFDEKIKTFYQRLRANGKPFKVAIVACMRKLLTILNAMVRDELQKQVTVH